ncbi:hypothetical protein ABZP36_026271 [Zizania latifolia]
MRPRCFCLSPSFSSSAAALPRIRHGYAHVVNNLYDGWRDYAIGGSMGPSVKSQGNLFAASGGAGDNKKVTRRMPAVAGVGGKDWHWHSVGDAFENGAFFRQVGNRVPPNYSRQQAFPAASAGDVRALTSGVGALRREQGYVVCKRGGSALHFLEEGRDILRLHGHRLPLTDSRQIGSRVVCSDDRKDVDGGLVLALRLAKAS